MAHRHIAHDRWVAKDSGTLLIVWVAWARRLVEFRWTTHLVLGQNSTDLLAFLTSAAIHS
jgi:hypothetical protein